jgi:WbqC-like protein family
MSDLVSNDGLRPDAPPGPTIPGPRGKRVAIVQSNYIPWKGYFDLINSVDKFILYDSVQYTRRDWRNRNRIKTPHGVQWLTIPVQVKGKYFQAIKDTLVSGDEWRGEHWARLQHSYARSPHFNDFRDHFESLYLAARHPLLIDINRQWIEVICANLGIRTPLARSEDYRLTSPSPTERLLEICLQEGAVEYLSGPVAREYLDEDAFRRAGVQVHWMDYSGYPEYPQLHGPFDHAVSVLDLLFMTGPRAPTYLKSFAPQPTPP